MLMQYNPIKIEPIFNFYLTNGFKLSIQKIADTVNITKKTLYNRYQSKENLEQCVMEFWGKFSCERVKQRTEYANNAVEKLILFLFELQYCRKHEFHFFSKMKELFLGNIEYDCQHIKQLNSIFNTGIEENFFRFACDQKVFTYFFLFNTLYILLNNELLNTDYLPFLLEPILTDKGRVAFKDIDIEQIFKL